MWKLLTFLWIAIGILSTVHSIEERESNNTQNTQNGLIFNSIPDEEKQYFIIYHLAAGFFLKIAENPNIVHIDEQIYIPKEFEEKFKKLNTPGNFSFELFHWTKQTFNLTASQVMYLALRHVICFGKNHTHCIDTADVSSHCCPF